MEKTQNTAIKTSYFAKQKQKQGMNAKYKTRLY